MINSDYKLLVLACCIFFCIANCVFSRQSEDSNDLEVSASEKRFKYSGSLECTVCHVTPAAKYTLNKVCDFVSLNEYNIWLNEDPHSKSYLSIVPDGNHFDAVSAKLAELKNAVDQSSHKLEIIQKETAPLAWGKSNETSCEIIQKVSGANQDQIGILFQEMTNEPGLLVKETDLSQISPPRLVSTVKKCMTCHAGLDLRENHYDFETVEYEAVEFSTGVSCEACHGPSSEWIDVHKHSEWRRKKPETKAEKFGLYNTRQPVARSQLCFSCHIGDAKQGRVVTHEMYAAGHPHLSSIEIESYADQIPRHWRYLSEKKDFKFAEEFKSMFSSDLDPVESSIQYEFPRTKNMLVGAVMASAQSTNLLVDSADEFLRSKSGIANEEIKGHIAWPDYATFDCASCHHDLKTDGEYRTFAGTPGRPPAVRWPLAMTKLAVAYLSVQGKGEYSDELYSLQKEMQEALDQQPFGNPDRLVKSGTRQFESLLKTARQLQRDPLTRDDAIRVLQLLCGCCENPIFAPDEEEWDFHSARQLVWAINLVYSEIMQPRVPGQKQLSDQFTAPQIEFSSTFAELKDYLLIDLAGPGAITTSQDKFLMSWKNFDNKKFKKLISRLSRSIQNEGFHLPDDADKLSLSISR